MGFGNSAKLFLEYEETFWYIYPYMYSSPAFLWSEEDKKALNPNQLWLLDINSIHRVQGFPYILQITIGGHGAEVFENLTDTQIADDITFILKRFVMKSSPAPIKIYRSEWRWNRNFLGSHAYMSHHHDITVSNLAEPIYSKDGRLKLLFAGEHTDSKALGSAHGAVASGLRAAKEFLQYYE